MSVRLRTIRLTLFGIMMIAIRLYISALTILFTVLVIASRGLGILEAVVITCAVVYLIIDTRIDLLSVKGELVLLKELEKQISVLLRYQAK
jgi:hypothetical protein